MILENFRKKIIQFGVSGEKNDFRSQWRKLRKALPKGP
jgi:hypothetical protein